LQFKATGSRKETVSEWIAALANDQPPQRMNRLVESKGSSDPAPRSRDPRCAISPLGAQEDALAFWRRPFG
jgi:hypothetical protein